MKVARAKWMALTAFVAVLSVASPGSAQVQTQNTEPAATQAGESDEIPSVGQVLKGTFTNFSRLPTRTTVMWLIAGSAGAAATHPADTHTTQTLAGNESLHEPLEPGAIVGGTPFELGASIAAYGIGRAMNKPRVARLGAELIQAQLMAESLAFGIKQVARRARPQGSGFSFPSGHTTVSFASADVLQRTFGWKVGAPAYAVASYVAASRIQSRNHFLSDVVFGAALGTIAGRTVPVSRSRRLAIAPMASAGRAEVVFSLVQ